MSAKEQVERLLLVAVEDTGDATGSCLGHSEGRPFLRKADSSESLSRVFLLATRAASAKSRIEQSKRQECPVVRKLEEMMNKYDLRKKAYSTTARM